MHETLCIVLPDIAMSPARAKAKFDGSRLSQALKHRGLSQNELEGLVGVSHGTVSRYVSGERKPSADNLAMIVSALGVSLAWLTRTSDDPDFVQAWVKPDVAPSQGAPPFESGEVQLPVPRRPAPDEPPPPQDEYPDREAVIIAIGDSLDQRVLKLLLRLKGPAVEDLDFDGWLAKAKEIKARVEGAQREYEGQAPAEPKPAAKRSRLRPVRKERVGP